MARVPPRPLNSFVRRERVPAPDHKAFIRTLPCVLNSDCQGHIECAHVSYVELRYGKFGRGYGQKEEDRWTVPLCFRHHQVEQHRMNEREFWKRHGIDPCIVALCLWGCTGDREAALVVLSMARVTTEAPT